MQGGKFQSHDDLLVKRKRKIVHSTVTKCLFLSIDKASNHISLRVLLSSESILEGSSLSIQLRVASFYNFPYVRCCLSWNFKLFYFNCCYFKSLKKLIKFWKIYKSQHSLLYFSGTFTGKMLQKYSFSHLQLVSNYKAYSQSFG